MDSLNLDPVQIYAIAVTIVAILLGAALANERVAKGALDGLCFIVFGYHTLPPQNSPSLSLPLSPKFCLLFLK